MTLDLVKHAVWIFVPLLPHACQSTTDCLTTPNQFISRTINLWFETSMKYELFSRNWLRRWFACSFTYSLIITKIFAHLECTQKSTEIL